MGRYTGGKRHSDRKKDKQESRHTSIQNHLGTYTDGQGYREADKHIYRQYTDTDRGTRRHIYKGAYRDRQVGRQANIQTQTGRQRQRLRQTDIQPDIQADIQTDRQTSRPTNNQTQPYR